MLSTWTHAVIQTACAPIQLARKLLERFTHNFLRLKVECACSISSSFLLDLYISWQRCSYVYYGNLLFPPPPLFFAPTPSLRALLLSPFPLPWMQMHSSHFFLSLSLCCCNVRLGGRERNAVEGRKRENVRG